MFSRLSLVLPLNAYIHTGIIISGEMYVASSEYFRLNNVAKYKYSKGGNAVSPSRGSSNCDYIHTLSTTSAESAIEDNGTFTYLYIS